MKNHFINPKCLFLVLLFCISNFLVNAQYQCSLIDGGSIVVDIGINPISKEPLQVNENSTLRRLFVVLNESKCPVQLIDSFGLKPVKPGSILFLSTNGKIEPRDQEVLSVEIHYILYDAFDNYLTSLKLPIIQNIKSSVKLGPEPWWRGMDAIIYSYLTCVSYVAFVRSSSGQIWRFDPTQIKAELIKRNLIFNLDYIPR